MAGTTETAAAASTAADLYDPVTVDVTFKERAHMCVCECVRLGGDY